MTARVARRSLRARLALTTAIAGVLLTLPGVAAGQTTPPVVTPVGTVNATSISGETGGALPTITSTGVATSTTTIELAAKNTVVSWDSLNVLNNGVVNQTLNFVNTTGAATTANTVAVLNRVTVAAPINQTTISGTINGLNSVTTSNTADARNVEVWISNPNGIMIGNGAAINTHGFVATTLPIADTDFTDGTGGIRLQSADPTDKSAITSSGTFQISTNGGVLAVVAPVVQLVDPNSRLPGNNGTFDAGAGGAAFVAATDVTMQNAGSPLSMTINRGTTLARGTGTGQGTALDVIGSITAGTALLVVSAQQFVDTLLNVDANVTAGATAGNGVVILAGNGTTNADSAGSVTFDAAATDANLGGGGSIQLGGAIVAGTGTAGLVLGARSTPPDTNGTNVAGAGTITATAASLTTPTLSARSYGDLLLNNATANAIAATSALVSSAGQVSLINAGALVVGGTGAAPRRPRRSRQPAAAC